VQVRILRKNSILYDGSETIKFDNYAYVLHGTTPYYISLDQLEEAEDDTGFATRNLGFSADNKPFDQNDRYIGFAGRVLVLDLPIYKYPTSTNQNLIIGYVNRNFALIGNSPLPGLKLNREITVPDANGRYYEVLVDADGNPPEDGYIDPTKHIYVGYINTRYIIDSYTSPSRAPNFQSNARITLPSWLENKLPVHAAANPDTAYKDEYLEHGQRIRLLEPLDRSKPFTQVIYYGGFEQELIGFIETAYIIPDGISGWQVAAIIGLMVSISVGIYIGIRHFRANKKGGLPAAAQ